jgi:hypothetical protein
VRKEIEVSDQSGISETLEELKARGYPAVHEFINKDGWVVVKIDHMLVTANAFPGAEVRCAEGSAARDLAFKEYRDWMREYRTWVDEMLTPPIIHSGSDSVMDTGMQLL